MPRRSVWPEVVALLAVPVLLLVIALVWAWAWGLL
jgi:hypothetical protein